MRSLSQAVVLWLRSQRAAPWRQRYSSRLPNPAILPRREAHPAEHWSQTTDASGRSIATLTQQSRALRVRRFALTDDESYSCENVSTPPRIKATARGTRRDR